MIEAAENAAAFVAGRSRADLNQDRMLLFALIRCVEIIGEASGKVSEVSRAQAPEIPWRAMVGMRNRLTHAYFDIDAEIVWKTATVELPALAASLRALLSKLHK
jgi:uncharacterized protein with HEPN domain